MASSLLVAAVGALLTLPPAQRRTAPPPDARLQAFTQQAAAYEQLVRTAVKKAAGGHTSTPSPATLQDRRGQIAAAMRLARPHAHRGDFFTPGLAPLLRARLAAVFTGADGAKVRASLRHAEPLATVLLPVNFAYPSTLPLQSMPPSLLAVLPLLPPDLEYDLVGRDLILHDLASNLVVDVLPDATPPL